MLENDVYILEKLLGNILILSKNAGKTFIESCNNLVFGGDSFNDIKNIFVLIASIEYILSTKRFDVPLY